MVLGITPRYNTFKAVQPRACLFTVVNLSVRSQSAGVCSMPCGSVPLGIVAMVYSYHAKTSTGTPLTHRKVKEGRRSPKPTWKSYLKVASAWNESTPPGNWKKSAV
jgi:hypothetical protein